MSVLNLDILSIMQNKPKGTIFDYSDFLSIGSYETIRKTMKRLVDDHKIVRIYDGLFVIPQYSNLLKKNVLPSVDTFAQAIAKKHGWTITLTANHFANSIGLTTQVPNDYSYLSTGPYRTFYYQNSVVSFLSANHKDLLIYNKQLFNVVSLLKKYKNIDSIGFELLDKYLKSNQINKIDHLNGLPKHIQNQLIRMMA